MSEYPWNMKDMTYSFQRSQIRVNSLSHTQHILCIHLMTFSIMTSVSLSTITEKGFSLVSIVRSHTWYCSSSERRNCSIMEGGSKPGGGGKPGEFMGGGEGGGAWEYFPHQKLAFIVYLGPHLYIPPYIFPFLTKITCMKPAEKQVPTDGGHWPQSPKPVSFLWQRLHMGTQFWGN